jgi:hypothetical protein
MKRQEEAVALMIVAQAEGRHPGTVASEYHIIQGRPALKADAILARFQSAGGRVEWHDHNNEKVSATFTHAAGGSLKVDWDLARAKEAGLGGKDNWKKYPRQMLRARVISEGVRAVYPAVLQGFYTPEEVQDFTSPVAASATPPAIEDKPAKPAKKPKEVAQTIEAEIVPEVQGEGKAEENWISPLESVLGSNESPVNAFLVAKGQIEAGQTWRDLPDNAYRQRIVGNPEGFVAAATGAQK